MPTTMVWQFVRQPNFWGLAQVFATQNEFLANACKLAQEDAATEHEGVGYPRLLQVDKGPT
jgi:hypothetical protein